MAFASGQNAVAICDRCGREVPYVELKHDVYNQKWTGLLVCSRCHDVDNEQLQVGKNFKPEAIALQNPRSNAPEIAVSRAFFGWNPVLGLTVQIRMGIVTTSGG